MKLMKKLGEILPGIRQKINLKNINPEKVKNVLLILYSVLLLSTIYHFIYAKRIIPGVKVAGVRVGGMTFSQAKDALVAHEKTSPKELKLKYDNKEFIIQPGDIGLIYDWDATVSRAFEVGRTGNLFSDTKEKIAGVFKSLVVPASYDYDDQALGVKFSIIKGEVNMETKDAGVVLSDGKVVVSASEVGRKVGGDELYNAVVTSFDTFDFSDKNVPIKTVNPQIVENDLSGVLGDIEKIISKNLTVVHGNKTWVLTSLQLLDLITFKKSGSKVKLILNTSKFDAFVETVANVVNELPRGQVTAVNGKTVVNFQITVNGKELNISKFSDDFESSMLGDRVVVQVPVSAVSGPGDKEKYGIFALLGEGTSHFTGSIPGRDHNIRLASGNTNGVLVSPGGIYSLNDSVGEIDSNHGFQTAYIIKGDRTVLGIGGGVCQVATTMYRAVLNSGLPVLMRYPHAYRAAIYEQDSPVGFDAAVFQPSWDFKFKNDTTAYVLVQTVINDAESSLTFKLYGTPDGRTVEINGPVITNQIAPPAAVYLDDPTLLVGRTIQVEHPAWGATVVLTRTVKRGTEVLFTETFHSIYQPWRPVYLVGTKK